MHISELIARHLKIEHFRELEPYASINGVTLVELEVPSEEQNYRIQLVKDSHFVNVKLEEGAKLAAFYNSRFWHEAVSSSKQLSTSIPSAQFFNAFQVSDEGQKYSVYLTKYTRAFSKPSLDLQDFEEIARVIARIHAVQSETLKTEFESAVQENFGNIKAYRRKIQKEIVQVLAMAVNSDETSRFFKHPSRILEKVSILIHHLQTSSSPSDEENQKVICHGRLTSETCRFDESGKLIEITDWENIHLGNPAEDLTNLIICSADSELQRRTFMKVFHEYFYTLVDIRPPKYQLPDLKRWFRENHARAVVEGIEQLLITISDNETGDDVKITAALRWEHALDNAVDYITDNYLSDDEQVFFSNK